MRELVFLWVLMVLALSSYTLLALIMRVELTFRFTFVRKSILVITQGYIGVSEQSL